MQESLHIPNKSVFKLNEVSALTDVKPYVLRFWESEFEEISPINSSSGQRLYEHKDIETIQLLKNLLFEQNMSVTQAKAYLRNSEESCSGESEPAEGEPESIIVADEATPSAYFSQPGRSLSDLEVQKLVLAKAKLNSIIQLIDSF